MWQRRLGMCVVQVYAQLLDNQLQPAQGILHFRLLLREQSGMCVVQVYALLLWEESGWLAQSAAN